MTEESLRMCTKNIACRPDETLGFALTDGKIRDADLKETNSARPACEVMELPLQSHSTGEHY